MKDTIWRVIDISFILDHQGVIAIRSSIIIILIYKEIFFFLKIVIILVEK